MSWHTNCVETVRNGDEIALLRADGDSRYLLAILTDVDYAGRVEIVQKNIAALGSDVDPSLYIEAAMGMFSRPEQYGILPAAELYSYAQHLGAGVLDAEALADRDSVIAHTDMRGMAGQNPYMPEMG
jgi:hypothetical protein